MVKTDYEWIKMRAVLAIGSEDSAGTRSGENLAAMIENLRGQGFTEFAVVPPNVEVNAARFNEILSAAQTAGAQIINGTFGTDDPARLTPTSAATIARQFADATIIGDSNAVRINGGVITDLANVDFSTTTLANAVSAIGGNPDLLDPRALASAGLAEGSRIFQGAYDQATEALRNIGGRTFVVPRTEETGGITDTTTGSTQGTVPQAPDAAQQRLQQVSSTRPYVPIRTTEDRYDFLTGRKVFSTAGDGPPGSGGGSGPGQGGGTRNLRGVRGTAPSAFNGRSSGSVNSVPSTEPEARTTPSTTYGQTGEEEGRFTNSAGETYTQSDIESVEALRSFNTDIGGGEARVRLTPGERAYAAEQGYL